MNGKKYMAALIGLCAVSYMLMCGFCGLEKTEAYTIPADAVIDENKPNVVYENPVETEPENKLVRYISDSSGLSYEVSLYLVDECEHQSVDAFLIMGLVERESGFSANAQGAHGERGLGQLMENTAVPVARNLGIEYKPERMFEPKYNLRLTITQVAYLQDVYGKDVHKTLTAYNRGQQGLINYMETGESSYEDPSMSDYSVSVLKNAAKYKEEFEMLYK